MGCQHLWQQEHQDCPYGFKLPFDVTWPDAAKAHSYGLPADESSEVWIFVNVLYSYVPLTVLVVHMLRLIVVRGSRELCIASVLIFTFVLNELILKQVFRHPRPEESCCTSCGMPSSHSAFALSLWGFHAYELLWRLQLRPFSWVDWEHLRESAKEAQRAAMRSWDELDALQCLLLCGFWTVLLGPVPFTRVILGDHSVEQVMIGSIVGLSSSLTVWMAARALQKSHNHQLDEDWCCGEHRLIRHNMALPLSSVRRRLQRGTPEPARRELQWYIDKLSAEIDRSDARPYAKHRFKEMKRSLEACRDEGSHFPVDLNDVASRAGSSQDLADDQSDDLQQGSRARSPTWPTEPLRMAGEVLGDRFRRFTGPGGERASSAPATWTPTPCTASSSSTFPQTSGSPRHCPLQLASFDRLEVFGQIDSLETWEIDTLRLRGTLDHALLRDRYKKLVPFADAKPTEFLSHQFPVEICRKAEPGHAASEEPGAEASFKTVVQELPEDVVHELHRPETCWEELRTFLEGKEEKNLVLRDRHGHRILLDELKHSSTSISHERFPLQLAKEKDGTTDAPPVGGRPIEAEA